MKGKRVPCTICGKWYRQGIGMSTHKRRAHKVVKVGGVEAVAEHTAPENEQTVAGMLKSFRMSLDHLSKEIDVMGQILEDISGVVGL